MKRVVIFLGLLLPLIPTEAQDEGTETTFNFGGYIKADFINSWYQNGDVGETSPLRDFHLPGQIPVGEIDRNFDLDYHVKESRFNFDVKTQIAGREIHGFIEMDFLMSKSGDEKISNSFNPRLRHAYVEWDRFLVGQTWSTFMIVVIPDEIDFAGVLDGLVFIRQPQLRYKAGNWWFAVENPETTITEFQESAALVTDSEILPDIVARRNFSGDWGTWSVAAIARTLHKRDSLTNSSPGFGITTGGKILTGKRDDFRILATYGHGLGRYLASGFISGAVRNEDMTLNPIRTLSGYVAFNHFWAEKLSSSFSVAAFHAFQDELIAGPEINQSSFSASGNLKWDPVPKLRLGVEYKYGYRGLLGGTQGVFHRIQVGIKYVFGYHNSMADEKR
jgi:hypothetical protein